MRLFLQSAQMGDCLHLHGLFGQMLEFAHDSGFEIAPDPFVRIELGRVTRQQMKRNLPVKRFNESSYLLSLVRGVPVNDQEDPALGSMNQAFDELDELVGTNCSLHYHEPESARRADRRDHVESEAGTCRCNYRSFSFRCPSGSRVIIGTDPGLVSEIDFTLAARCRAFNGGELFLEPLVNSLRILLISPPEWALRRETKLVEQSANGCFAEFNAILLLDKSGNHLPGPQRESELELERVAHRDGGINPLEHFTIEFRFAPAPLACLERVPSTNAIKSQPIVDGRPADTKSLGNHLGALAVLDGVDSACSQFSELSVIQLPAVCISNLLHAA